MTKKRIEARTQESSVDTLVPDPQVARELGGVSLMTIWRWSQDPRMDFPPAIKLGNRNYRSRKAVEELKARLIADAVRARGGEAGRSTQEAS